MIIIQCFAYSATAGRDGVVDRQAAIESENADLQNRLHARAKKQVQNEKDAAVLAAMEAGAESDRCTQCSHMQ
jgi:predicted NBD/HSP70 family sugar kinase